MSLGNITTSGGTSFATTTTVSHAAAGSPNIAIVAAYTTNIAGALTCTYGGVAMTAIPGGEIDNGAKRIKMFYLVNPTSGTQNVVATGSSAARAVVVLTAEGADTTTPYADVFAATRASATGALTRAVATAVDDIALLFVHASFNSTYTPDTGDTEFADATLSGGTGRYVANRETASGSSTTVGTSQASGWNAAYVALALKAAAVAAGGARVQAQVIG